MADSRQPLEVARPQTQGIRANGDYGVDGAANYVKGAVLILTSGNLTKGGANPTAIVGVAVHKHPLSNTQLKVVGMHIPAMPRVEFEASIDTSASEGTGTIAQTDMGAQYGITEDSNGVWYVDKNKTAAGDVRVVITKLVDPVGELLGRVRCTFLPNVNLGNATPVRATIYGGPA